MTAVLLSPSSATVSLCHEGQVIYSLGLNFLICEPGTMVLMPQGFWENHQ